MLARVEFCGCLFFLSQRSERTIERKNKAAEKLSAFNLSIPLRMMRIATCWLHGFMNNYSIDFTRRT